MHIDSDRVVLSLCLTIIGILLGISAYIMYETVFGK